MFDFNELGLVKRALEAYVLVIGGPDNEATRNKLRLLADRCDDLINDKLRLYAYDSGSDIIPTILATDDEDAYARSIAYRVGPEVAGRFRKGEATKEDKRTLAEHLRWANHNDSITGPIDWTEQIHDPPFPQEHLSDLDDEDDE